MKKELSDEQFDRLMQTMLTDGSLADTEIDKIAASPAIWWAVKREIQNQKAATVSPWPPANWLRRALIFGVLTLAAASVILSLVVWRTSDGVQNDVAVIEPVKTTVVPSDALGDPEKAEPAVPEPKSAALTPERAGTKRISAKPGIETARKVRETRESQEIKTEFIALSYARNPDSGQILRVKVPSTMMVTLGLVSTVEKPTDLIDAEVVVGDDGLTRAIRFIR